MTKEKLQHRKQDDKYFKALEKPLSEKEQRFDVNNENYAPSYRGFYRKEDVAKAIERLKDYCMENSLRSQVELLPLLEKIDNEIFGDLGGKDEK